ncbi:Murein DD-endopeptidase MepM [termite gut metagenome]|uniref:Murein DD-endopeptidase MepM n=1 Tax=termite gut metagenome TaxID=433724 RepID=A0A5J4QU29_9ZZZZ
MPRYRRRKSFWRKMMFKYKLTVINEDKLEDVLEVYVSKFNTITTLLSLLFILFIIIGCIMAYTPIRNVLPGYMNNEVRAQVVSNALRVDSFQQVIAMQNLYIMNIQDIFRGTVKADTVQSMDSLTVLRADSLKERTRREEEFRSKYEEAEKYNLTSITSPPDASGLNFFRPTRGMISGHFDLDAKHYGVDIAVNPNESVLATLEGTVILSTYTIQTGYLISVQHNQGFVSVYKHCGSLLKEEGDRVKAGDAIALVGNNKSTTGPHLHFELWYKGKPVNPENYVVF